MVKINIATITIRKKEKKNAPQNPIYIKRGRWSTMYRWKPWQAEVNSHVHTAAVPTSTA